MLSSSSSRLAVALVLGWTLLGCFINCDPAGPPEPSRCDNAPDRAELTALAIGSGPGEFAPLEDGAATTLEVGGQGLTMVALRIGHQGADAPSCMKAKITIRNPANDSQLDQIEDEYSTAPEGEWRATSVIYRIVEGWPEYVTVVVEAYGTTTTRTLRVGGDPSDAGLPDSGT